MFNYDICDPLIFQIQSHGLPINYTWTESFSWHSAIPLLFNSIMVGIYLQRIAILSTNSVDAMASVELILLSAIFNFSLSSELLNYAHNPAVIVFLLVCVAVEAAMGMVILLCCLHVGFSVTFQDKELAK